MLTIGKNVRSTVCAQDRCQGDTLRAARAAEMWRGMGEISFLGWLRSALNTES